jgi:hypothetical protein
MRPRCTGPQFFQPGQGAWTNSLEFDQIAGSDLGRRSRFGDGARSARARMARVNLTLSASREFDVAGMYAQ